MHYARHKNILTIVRKLAELDEGITSRLFEKIALQSPNSKSPERSQLGWAPYPNDDLKSDDGSPAMRRSERKIAKKMGVLNTQNKRQEVESFSEKDTNFISNALHCTIHESKGAWGGKNTCDAFCRHNESTEVDLEAEDKSLNTAMDALDLASTPPSNSKQRRKERKITAVEKAARHIHTKSKGNSPKKVSKISLLDGLDPQILCRLGINDIDPPKSSAVRKELIRKLIAQIKDDLAIQAQEQTEAKMREDGFWNWAGRGAYHMIMRNREDMDWATGVRRSINNEITSRQGIQAQVPQEIDEAENGAHLNGIPLDDASLEDIVATETELDVALPEPRTEMPDSDTTVDNKEVTMERGEYQE